MTESKKNVIMIVGAEHDNLLLNPFFPETEVTWRLAENLPDEDLFCSKNPEGHLSMKVSSHIDGADLCENVCTSNSSKQSVQRSCQFIEVPFNFQMATNQEMVFTLPKAFDSLEPEQVPIAVGVSFDSGLSAVKLRSTEEGFFRLTFRLLQDGLCVNTLRWNLRVKAADSAVAKTEVKAPPINDSLPPAEMPAQAPSQAKNLTAALIEPESAPIIEQPPPLPPPVAGKVWLILERRSDGALLDELPMKPGKSLIVGRSSSSASLFVDLDLKPYLSTKGVEMCSRNQLKILLSQDRVFVKNIGNCEVLLDDHSMLTPDQGIFVATGRHVVVAEELLVAIIER